MPLLIIILNDGLSEYLPWNIIMNTINPIVDCPIGCEMFERVTYTLITYCKNGVIIKVCKKYATR